MARPPNPFSSEAEIDAAIDRHLPATSPFGAAGETGLSPLDDRWPARDRANFDVELRRDGIAPPSGAIEPLDFDLPFTPSRGRNLAGGFGDRGMALPASLIPGTETGAERAFELAALNPLVGVASSLLWLSARLNESLPIEDVQLFRARVAEEISRFETNAMAKGISSRSTLVARYALCATIDDIILNTEWGGQSDWAVRGLVSGFYQETWGGERFFDLLGQLYGKPEENIDALELMAVCLSIGFVGKFRIMDGGAVQLVRLRTELYRTIRRVRGPHERALTTSFAPMATPYKAPTQITWFWVASGVTLLGIVLLYLVLGLVLSWRIGAAADRVAGIAPALPVLVVAPAPPAVTAAPVPPATAASADSMKQIQRMSGLLTNDIAQGQVEVARHGDDVLVRLLHASFPSGGAALSEAQTPIVQRVAAALNSEAGPITVIGHTDDSPIANASTTHNNLTLSRSRAASAAALLQRYLTDPGRVSFVGRGDADPVTSNATSEGKARNRRVEFSIPAEKASP